MRAAGLSTLGERLTRDAVQRMRRAASPLVRLPLAAPVLRRAVTAGSRAERFERRDRLLQPAFTPELAADPGAPLASPLRERVEAATGRRAPGLRVHSGEAADAVARSHAADAVALGDNVYFRSGRFRPERDDGVALLVHEATHVIESREPGAAWRRATTGGVSDEERRALAAETAALTGASPPAERPPPPPPAAPPPAAERPMAAATDRTSPAPATGPTLDVAALRRELQRELLDQIRTEIERGG